MGAGADWTGRNTTVKEIHSFMRFQTQFFHNPMIK